MLCFLPPFQAVRLVMERLLGEEAEQHLSTLIVRQKLSFHCHQKSVCVRAGKMPCEADGLCRVALKFEWAPRGYVYAAA